MGVQYLCSLRGTKYLTSWRIHLSWWHGFEKDSLESIGSEAVIDAFCRSNYPIFERIKNGIDGFRGRETHKLEDKYKVYLRYKEDAAGVCTYWFEIVDHAAAMYDMTLRTKGEEAARGLPKGFRRVGMVIPGQRSYQGLLGIKGRKLEEWTMPEPTKPRASATALGGIRRIFKKK